MMHVRESQRDEDDPHQEHYEQKNNHLLDPNNNSLTFFEMVSNTKMAAYITVTHRGVAVGAD